MNALVRNTVLFLFVWLMLAGVCLAKQVHMRDGSIIDCESVWRRGDKVVVKINRDTMLEFKQEEVDVRHTFPKAVTKPRHTRKRKPVGAVRPHHAAQSPVNAASSPLQAAPEAAAPLPAAKPVPSAAPTPSATPDPAPAPDPPQPSASATGQPEPAQAASAGTSAPPDNAEQDAKGRPAADMMAEAIQNKDPELLKQAIETQKSAMPRDSALSAGASLTVALILLAVCLLVVVSLWVVFVKAGEAGWKCLIPIYNMYVLLLISGKPGWWLILLFIPVVGAVFQLLSMLSLAERFGRGALYGVGLFLLPMIFFPLLAFGDSQYEG